MQRTANPRTPVQFRPQPPCIPRAPSPFPTSNLLAVSDRMARMASHIGRLAVAADVALAEQIRRTVRFTRAARFMHRLMIEELAETGTNESGAKMREMNFGVTWLATPILSFMTFNKIKYLGR